MRSLVVLRLALSLFAARSAVAGPCKPFTTTSEGIPVASTDTSSVVSATSSTVDFSATSVSTESSTETYVSSSLETSSFATTETSATTTFITELSTIESTTVEPTTTEGTTTVPATTESMPTPTFTIFATGESVIEGDALHTFDTDGYVATFDPNAIFGETSVRPYSIDSQGRLVNDQGYFLCATYVATNKELNAPAVVGTCTSDGPKKAFLDCTLSSDLALRCGIPGRSCVSNPVGEPICEVSGTWSTLSTGSVIVGHALKIGPADIPVTPVAHELIGLRASIV
ncbi:unnamed protein product [Fusarium graminearum]|uniref:Uncharacterized protein n=1 Tax=Gibberella zeae TaxID=5518 RepID=A0A9N8WZ08_GIBZA|nr:unnamed protein product [Fusarium graminearum]